MDTETWDKFFLKAVKRFPSWNVDRETSLAWYEKLHGYDINLVAAAFDVVCVKSASFFPPSVYQVLAEIGSLESGSGQADEQWLIACGKMSGNLSPAGVRAWRAIGGNGVFGMATDEQLPFIKRDFARAFEHFAEEKTVHIAVPTLGAANETAELISALAEKKSITGGSHV